MCEKSMNTMDPIDWALDVFSSFSVDIYTPCKAMQGPTFNYCRTIVFTSCGEGSTMTYNGFIKRFEQTMI